MTRKGKRKRGGGEAGEGGLVAGWIAFFLLHCAAVLLFPERIWGAHHARFLPVWFGVLWFAAAAALLHPRVRDRAGRAFEKGAERLAAGGPMAAAAATGAGFLLFLLFRSRNLFLGDGWLLSGIIDRGDPYRLGHAGYFTVEMYRGALAAFRAIRPETGAAGAMALVNALFGIPFLLAAPRVAAELAGGRRARTIITTSLLLSGGVLLFFGYVENYTPMQAAVLIFLWTSIRFLHGRGGPVAPSAALLLAVLLHHTAAVFLPAWFFLLLAGPRKKRTLRMGLAAAGLAASAAGVFLLRRAAAVYDDGSPFLPWFDRGGYSWSFLSADHLVFLGNLLLLLLGGALLLPFLRAPARAGGRTGPDRTVPFLAAASAGALLLPLLTDPLLGARDWDLMALPLFPLLLLLGALFLAGRRTLSPGAVALLAGGMLLHTVPWIAGNADRDRGVRMTLAMIARDPHYANPELRAPTALAVLLNNAGYAAEAEMYLEKSLRIKSRALDHVNLGKSRGGAGDFAGAIVHFERAVEADSGYADAWFNLAVARARSGDPDGAERDLRRLLRIDPDHLPGWKMLGDLLGRRGEMEETEAVFARCVELDPEDPLSWERLGMVRAKLGKREAAEEALRRALRIDPGRTAARSLLEELERAGG